jgi:hypothetical protein
MMPPYSAASLVHVNQFQPDLVTNKRYMKLSPGKLTHEEELAGRQPARGMLYWGYRLALPACKERHIARLITTTTNQAGKQVHRVEIAPRSGWWRR